MNARTLVDKSEQCTSIGQMMILQELSSPRTPSFQLGDQVGRHPIDAVYLTPDLPLEASTWISKIHLPGDHHSCRIEICWKALVGEDMFKITHPDAHHLSSSTYCSTVEYSRILTSYEAQHKLLF
jgi:hypothetical protein